MSAVELLNPRVNIKHLKNEVEQPIFHIDKYINIPDDEIINNIKLKQRILECSILNSSLLSSPIFDKERQYLLNNSNFNKKNLNTLFNFDTYEFNDNERNLLFNGAKLKLLNLNIKVPEELNRLLNKKLKVVKDNNSYHPLNNSNYFDYLVNYKILFPQNDLSYFLSVVDNRYYESLNEGININPESAGFIGVERIQKILNLKILNPQQFQYDNFEKLQWFIDANNYLEKSTFEQETVIGNRILYGATLKILAAKDILLTEKGIQLKMPENFTLNQNLPRIKLNYQGLPIERSFV